MASPQEPVGILLVEDNPADVYLIQQALTLAGLNFVLTVLDDGADALLFAQGAPKYAGMATPGAIVLDLNLPKIDGSELLAAIRQSERLRDVPIAILTSSSAKSTPLSGVLEPTLFLTKPLDLEEFLKIGWEIKEMIARS